MISRIANGLVTRLKQNGLLRRIKFRGLSVASNVTLNIKGSFAYGKGCGIGVGSNILVPEHASLSLGDGCYIGRYVELGPAGHIMVGSSTSIQDRCILLGDVTIGRYCTFAPNIYISSGKHYFDLIPNWLIKDQDKMVASDKQLSSSHSKAVQIEDDCWLGINVVVMAGVTIGKGSVIGANSVVTRNVDPYTVVAGAPSRLVRKRLEFVPPPRISYDNPSDWPYFYSGFEISRQSQEKYSAFEGMVALNDFTICLDTASGISIHVIIRSIDSKSCTLIYGNQSKTIADQFDTVTFECDSHSKETSKMHMFLNANKATLVVKKAWIE